jgi:hypothetical protein
VTLERRKHESLWQKVSAQHSLSLPSKIFFPSQSFKSISFLSKTKQEKIFRLKKYTEEDFENF